jgi:hypothetical protein
MDHQLRDREAEEAGLERTMFFWVGYDVDGVRAVQGSMTRARGLRGG